MAAEPTTLESLASLVTPTQMTTRKGSDVAITDIEHDSRRITPGAAFIALPGRTVDGHDFAAVAAANGAAAVICERELNVDLPQLIVDDTRSAMGAMAARVHGHPAKDMTMIGITGTNGKTTVTHMLEGIARQAGLKTGLVGTIGAHIGDESIPLTHTTPEATELHRLFATMHDRKVDVVMIEVSSHALVMHRVDGLTFDVSGFTNLSQDHLDFHETMEAYFQAKAELFTQNRTSHGVVVVTDRWGKRLATEATVPITTVALDADGDVVGTLAASAFVGSTIDISVADRQLRVSTPLAGWFNAANAVLAATIAVHLGWPDDAIAAGISAVGGIAGRFEKVEAGQPFTVIVDYAHTPEAISVVVDAVRALTPGRVIAVGGAGGDRDAEKRSAMGAALGGADLAVVTSDNPRTEDPAAIVAAVAAGLPAGVASIIEVDRRSAMRAALASAEPDDVVLLLGRGHEPTQDLGATKVPFSDRAVAEELISELAGEQA